MFVPLGIEQFQPVTFTGSAWNLVPPNLRKAPKKHKKTPSRNQNPSGQPTANPTPYPYPTYSCDPQQVTCSTAPAGFGQGNAAPAVSGTAAGAAVGGIFAALPVGCLWVRRRMRRRRPRRG
jgi:hypothetical protein